MFTEITNLCAVPFKPSPGSTLIRGSERTYKIGMLNYYLDNYGGIYKKQELQSTYTRTVKDLFDEAILFLQYRWDQMIFSNRVPKIPSSPIEWTFARGLAFHSHILLSNEKINELLEAASAAVSAEDHKNCFISIQESYKNLPKVPAVYLLIMQTMDILAFENYLSYVFTHASTHGGWKMGETVRIAPPEQEHLAAAQIGFGFYSENSIFKNSKFHLTLIGYGTVKGRPCAVFDYYCDHSKVKMQEKDRANVQRNGTSYYSGKVWVDLETCDVEKGEMLESYIAMQEGDKKQPVHIRRKVICESVQGGEEDADGI